MATFASFIDSAANLTVSADERTYTITGDWNWDGALDDNAFPRGEDGVTIILDGAGAKLRCSAGASGTFGGYGQPIHIIERSNAHPYPNDNGNPSSPTDCRFVGAGTTVWDNVLWEMESRTDNRSDFDVGRNFVGTFRGLRLYQPFQTNGTALFNHIFATGLKLEIGTPGYGFSIRNERNAHAISINAAPNAQFAGLAVDNVDIPVNKRNEGATKGSSGRVVVSPSGTMVLTALDTETITEDNDGSGNTVRLIDPIRIPTRTANWQNDPNTNNGYGSNMEIWRNQPFQFNLVASATGTLYADSQDASNGLDASVDIPANGNVSIPVRTHWSAYAQGAWSTAVDSYRFHAVGINFSKYFSGTTNISVGLAPTTRTVSLTPITFPDGSALFVKSTGTISTAADLAAALQTYEIANPEYPNVSTRLMVFSNDALLVSTAEIVLDPDATEFIARSGNTITIKAASTGISASNGIGLVNLGTGYATPSGTRDLINLPITDSTGTNTYLNITAHANEVVGVFKNDGTKLGNNSFASNGTWQLEVSAADSLANTRIGLEREGGYQGVGRTIDISAGGSFNEAFENLELVPGLDGTGQLYDSTANPDNTARASIHTSASTPFEPGDCTIGLYGKYSTAADVYKAYKDALSASNGEGCRAVAFGRQPLSIVNLNGQPGNIFLGGDCILQRGSPASENTSAGVQAFPIGGIGGNPVHDDEANPILYQISVGSCNLNLINQNITEVKTKTNTIIEQGEHIATSLPISFPTGSPLSPLVVICGLAGQSIIRDVESRGYTITPTGVGLDTDARGIMTFSGTNSHIDLSLERVVDGVATNHTKEIIALMQVRPTTFNATEAQPLFSIGAALVSIAPSSGTAAALRIGVTGAQDTTEMLTLNEWNTIVISFQQRKNHANYPIIRVSVNGGAQQKWNDGSDHLFAQIASSTTNFRIGARSTGGNTSVGFIGDARALWVHPNNSVYSHGGATGWNIGTGIYWSELHQLYLGAHLADRVEGVLSDVYEPIVDEIAEKTFTLEEQAAAVLSQPFSQGISAGNSATSSLTAYTKWLAGNVNTTTPDSKADIAAEIGARVMPEDPTAGTYDAAMKNAEEAYTGTPPTTAAIATAVGDELTIPTAAQNATAVSGALDIPTATEIAEEVRDLDLTNAEAGKLGAVVSSIKTSVEAIPTDSKAEIAEEVVKQWLSKELETGVSLEKALQMICSVLGGVSSVSGNIVEFKGIGASNNTIRLQITTGSTAGVRTASVIDPPPPSS